MSESVSGTLNKKIHLTIFPLFPSMSWLFLQQTLLSQKLKKTNQKERRARVRTCQGQGLALLCFAFVQNSLSVAQHPFFSLTYLSPWPALYNILKAILQCRPYTAALTRLLKGKVFRGGLFANHIPFCLQYPTCQPDER